MGRPKKIKEDKEPISKQPIESEDKWLGILKVSLNDKKMFHAILTTLIHVQGIYCIDCLQNVPLKEQMFAHTNGHLCGASRITGLINNLQKEKEKRGF